MAVRYKLGTLLKQTGFSGEELLRCLCLSVPELLGFNDITLENDISPSEINFEKLASIVPIDTLEIPEERVHPYRKNLLRANQPQQSAQPLQPVQPLHPRDIAYILEFAMWSIITQLRHRNRPSPVSKEMMDKCAAAYSCKVRGFEKSIQEKITDAYQRADDALITVMVQNNWSIAATPGEEYPGETRLVELTNVFLAAFARSLSQLLEVPVKPFLINANEKEIRYGARKHHSFFAAKVVAADVDEKRSVLAAEL